MTQCNPNPIEFSSLGRKKVVADFAGGTLTSDAGALLLREVDQKIGLIDALNACIPDPRHPALTVHDQRTMLAQRILGIACGYEDLNDHQTLRNDPIFQALAERAKDADQPLASPPTLCRLENRINRRALVKMSQGFVEAFIASFSEPPQELVLDFDPTDDPVHGHQEKRFFHGYYDEYCFLPLYAFCGDQLLVAYLRPADRDAAHHSWAILSLLVRRFRQVWPKVQIIFRGDSGLCRWRMMRWCDRHEVGYILGLARNSVLEKMAAAWTKQAEAQFTATGQKQRLFHELSYAAETWDRERRVIVKAEHLDQGPNLRFLVTNLPGDPQALYEDLYCQRGEVENRIKEQQLMLFADRTSCHDFTANQFRVLLSAAAYVLMETLRREGLADTPLAHAQVSTIRLKLLKIGARVVGSFRRIVLHLAGGYPWADLLTRLVTRLRQLSRPRLASG
jgi:hypothetical protein